MPKTKCKDCEREFSRNTHYSEWCAACRKKRSKPIDTVCAGCGVPAHALFCPDCAKPLVEGGKLLQAQEQWNRLSKKDREKRKLTNPQYSEGQFALKGGEQKADP